MLKIAVCDDNADFLRGAVRMIKMWSDKSGIPAEIFEFDNGDELIEKNAIIGADIVFLDIIMPTPSGMETARALRRRDGAVRIIFLTSSAEFALESYDVKAKGYLLKPVSYEKIGEILNECARELEEEPKNLVTKTAFGYQKLYFRDIEYAEAQNKRVVFYLRSEKTIESTETLHSFEDKLTDENGFFKCHRSYLVYLPNVDHFGNTEITMKSGRCIPIARGYGRAFKEAYFALMFDE